MSQLAEAEIFKIKNIQAFDLTDPATSNRTNFTNRKFSSITLENTSKPTTAPISKKLSILAADLENVHYGKSLRVCFDVATSTDDLLIRAYLSNYAYEFSLPIRLNATTSDYDVIEAVRRAIEKVVIDW